jgi:hypothetical protein
MTAHNGKTAGRLGILDSELKKFEEVKNFRETYKSLPSECVIYIFIFDSSVNRLKGSSRILKIGETTNFKKRMARYFNVKDIQQIEDKPKRQTAYRLRSFIDSKEKSQIKLYYKSAVKKRKAELRIEEKRLLKMYLSEHLETPPLNMGMS